MRILSELAYRLRALFRRGRVESDLDDELRLHLEIEEQRRLAAGQSPAEARRMALAALGGRTAVAEACRDERRLRWLGSLARDIRYGTRSLRANPVLTLAVVGSLALGIGANTALFSIMNGLMLRPLPVNDPASLALLDDGSWTNPIWEQIRARDRELFAGGFAWSERDFDTAVGGERQPIRGAYVSGGMFDVLGLRASRGRLITTADDTPNRNTEAAVAVISHGFWQRQFAAADDIVGRQIVLQRVPFTIVGVAPSEFFGPTVGRSTDVFVPLAAERLTSGGNSMLDGRSTWWLEIMVRRKPRQTLEQATAALVGLQPQIRAATLPNDSSEYLNQPFQFVDAATGRSSLRTTYGNALTAITVIVAIVLVIACANIANLLLARTTSRHREISVRRALGASRVDVAGMLFVESLLLACAGALAGLVVAHWGSQLLLDQLNASLDVSLDWRVLGFTTAVTASTALLFGVAPALAAARVRDDEALRGEGRGAIGDRRISVRNALVVVQVALSMILVVAGLLFGRTFAALNNVPLGFTAEPLIATNISLPVDTPPERRMPIFKRLAEEAGAVPGVGGSAMSSMTPVTGAVYTAMIGDNDGPRDLNRRFFRNVVSPGWFTLYGMRILTGRDFSADDRPESVKVAVVNETFVRRFLPNGSPIGQVVRMSSPTRTLTYEVVGVVTDAVYRSAREGVPPTMYEPLSQRERADTGITLTLHVGRDRAARLAQVGAAFRRVDPNASFAFRSFDDIVAATVARERLVAMLAGAFGTLAIVLAGLGIYGLVSFAVSRRRAEIGLRLALGAVPSQIVRLVLGRTTVLVAMGAVGGLAISAWLSAYASALLFQLEPRDPTTFVAALMVIAFVAAFAAWLPARRAARVSPSTVLTDS